MPSLTAEGWARFSRAVAREKLAGTQSVSELSEEVREVIAERTFIQNIFDYMGPRVRKA